jgi:probable F420-dependent oxidoreductase
MLRGGTVRTVSTQHRPFRFGIQAAKPPTNVTWQQLARRAEALGYATLTMPDHFNDQFAPIPAMTSALEVTSSLRVCALVFDNDYKHPVVLAKELATMDVLSGGRIDIGLGAGWMRTDYDELGIPYDTAGVRIDRFVEGLAIVRSCMRGEAFSHAGTHYTIRNHTPTPRAVQQPCPPVLIGAGGRRMLGIAAREADIVGINPSLAPGAVGPDVINDMSVEAFEDKVEIVRAAAGDRFAGIELNVRAFLVNVTNDAKSARDGLAAMLGVDPRMVAESPFALIGSPDELVDRLLERRERFGVSYVIVGGDDVESFAPVVAALAGR